MIKVCFDLIRLSQHTISNFILEQLFCSKLEDVIELLLRHGARFGAQTRSHDQMGQHHLLLCHLLAGQIKTINQQALGRYSENSYNVHV